MHPQKLEKYLKKNEKHLPVLERLLNISKHFIPGVEMLPL
jgi:hypothetical protein